MGESVEHSVRAVVAQRGAREHFLAARAFERAGCLAGLVADWYAPQGAAARLILSACGNVGRRMLAVEALDVPREKVLAFRYRTLAERLIESPGRGRGNRYARWLRSDSRFSGCIARANLPPHNVFFAYAYAALEALEAERARGVLTILDQIDPGPAHYQMISEEERTWPSYVERAEPVPDAYLARNRREWDVADIVLVNSEWSRTALVSAGCAGEKIEVLPLAYEPPAGIGIGERRGSDVLRVLWVGHVNVNKGIQYLVEAAGRLLNEKVRFIVVGRIDIPHEIITSAPRNVEWVGPVSRYEVHHFYMNADVFVLPTISDGFAITQLEALSHGLPVIVTPNCGRVAEHCKTGFIVPARDPQALAETVMKFVRNRDLAADMSSRCREAVKAFGIDSYTGKLMDIIRRGMARCEARNLPLTRNPWPSRPRPDLTGEPG